jgi:hypothetical protein
MSALDFPFEELALFSTDDGLFTALVDGGCDVSFAGPEEFQITDIYLCVDNGLTGSACRSDRRVLKVRDDPALWLRVRDAIVERYRDRIEERINEEMAEAA